MKTLNLGLIALLVASSMAARADVPAKPARAPAPHCAWERFSDPGLALSAWVQRCDYGDRKIDFVAFEGALAIRYSDSNGAPPDHVVDLFDLQPGESAEAGIARILAARTDAAVAARCRLAPYGDAGTYPPGVKRYTFSPDAAYAKALAADADPEEVPDPPCGDWGEAPDGIQYFETQAGAGKVLFVQLGQDEPLFDQDSLQLR